MFPHKKQSAHGTVIRVTISEAVSFDRTSGRRADTTRDAPLLLEAYFLHVCKMSVPNLQFWVQTHLKHAVRRLLQTKTAFLGVALESKSMLWSTALLVTVLWFCIMAGGMRLTPATQNQTVA